MNGDNSGNQPPSDDDGWGDAADLERSLVGQQRDGQGAGPRDPLAHVGQDAAADDAEASPPQLIAVSEAVSEGVHDDADDRPAALEAGDSEDGEGHPYDEPAAVTDDPPHDGSGSTDSEPYQAHSGTYEAADEPVPPLPNDDLRSAVGLDDGSSGGDGGPPKRRSPRLSGKQRAILVAAALATILIGVGGILSWLNSQHYYFVCGTKNITAEKGRTWPWGQRTLEGPRWRPIPIGDECVEHSVDSAEELEALFLDTLLRRASELLTRDDPDSILEAEKELEQATLLTRSPQRRARRKEVDRLQGDVQYWRAAGEIEAAIQKLADAGKRFDDAAARRPRHKNDASSWAEHARAMSDEIRMGPKELRDETPVRADGRPHFTGTEPGSEPPRKAPTNPGDAGPDPQQPSPAAPDAGPPPPDAGLPRGGVLL